MTEEEFRVAPPFARHVMTAAWFVLNPNTEPARQCNQCGRQMPPSDPHRQCDRCRRPNR